MSDKKAVEEIASIIYEAMRFDRENETPEWQGGNSIAETEARAKAMRVIAAARPHILEEAARIADYGALVPPDGGSPTPEENAVAENIAAAIRAAKERGE